MIAPKTGPGRLAHLQWRLLSSTARYARKQPPPRPARAQASQTIGREFKTPRERLLKQPSSTQPPPPPPPPPEPETLLDHWRTSWLPLTGAAVFAGLLGFYIFGTATASFRDSSPCGCAEHATPTGRPPALTGDNAEQFDKELNLPETLMGIASLRRRIAERAQGDVLELAMGSGRNLEYYNWQPLSAAATAAAAVASAATDGVPRQHIGPGDSERPRGITAFTGLDVSADMLDVARRKLTKTVPPMATSAPIVRASTMHDQMGGQLSYLDGHLRLVNSDAHNPIPPPRTAAKYDTIIQTFGLCSVSDPVAVLSNLASAVKPGTGRIILLEHGKGWFGIVNGLLDRNAGKHFAKYGCWWNRDIQALVEEAAKKTPGLEVVKIERPNILQMGTLIWVELQVAQGP